jgi:uncharacterized membrane-anchored protein
MMKFITALIVFSFASFGANADVGDDAYTKSLKALNWQAGPQIEKISNKATIKTKAGLYFLDEENSKKFLEITGNIPELGNFIIYSEKDWWADFSFSGTGYVQDNEDIDASALLRTLKNNDIAQNKERERLGLPPMYTEDWYSPPHYDGITNQLEWGLKIRQNGNIIINYTTRLLGRTGVMSATLVSTPEKLDADVKDFKSALVGFDFDTGEKYAEFKPGDHVAEFGLGALIAGGAAAIAAKKGFWAVLAGFLAVAWKFVLAGWKIVAIGVVALFSWIASLFKRKK